MNVTPLAIVPPIAAPGAVEPAAPGGSEADHGVALEFAALLAGLLRPAAPTPPVIDGSAATSTPESDGETGEVESGDAGEAAAGTSNGASARQAKSDMATPIPARTAGSEMPTTASPAAQPAIMPQQSGELALPTAQADPVVLTPMSPVEEVDTPASATLPAAAAPAALAISGAAAATTDGAGGAAAVVMRLADAVVATVRQLLGSAPDVAATTVPVHAAAEPVVPDQPATVQSSTAAVAAVLADQPAPATRQAGAAELVVADQPATVPRPTTSATSAAQVTWATVVAAPAASNNSAGGEPHRQASGEESSDGTEQPSSAATSTGRSAFADLARLAGAASVAAPIPTPADGGRAAAMAAPVTAPPEPPAQPATPQTVTVRFDGPGGLESRIRVSVRGDLVHATILTDVRSAPGLEQALPELQRSLAERGFSESRVSVRIITTDGTPPVAIRSDPGTSDASRQRDGNGRPAPERDFAGDDRPRGKHHNPGEEAHP